MHTESTTYNLTKKLLEMKEIMKSWLTTTSFHIVERLEYFPINMCSKMTFSTTETEI